MSTAVLERASPAVAETRVVALQEAGSNLYEDYVNTHPQATFFHRLGWKNVIERVYPHECIYLVALRGERACGVLPLVHQRSLLFGRALISIPFGVYGGVLADDDAVAQALIDEAMRRGAELGVDYVEFRHRERHRADWPGKDLYVTFRKEISRDHDENLSAIPRKQRAMIRKGEKAGLDWRLTDTIEPFYSMYAESVRNLGTPVFARRYFQALKDEFAQDVEILVVEEQGTPVSAVMSFYHRDEVLPYYGGGTIRARAVKANDFMYWQVMRQSVDRGVRIFDYGRSKRDTGSYRFKKHWGFEPQPLDYEYGLVRADEMPDVSPANPKYRLFIAAWKRLPVPVSMAIGPWLARHLG